MGVRENSLSFNTQYFNISGGGVLYQSSRDPKEGFEEHINDKTGAVSYWRVFWNGIEGYLSDIFVLEQEMNGAKTNFLFIKISDEEGNYVIKVPLMTSRGGINSYVKSLVRYLPNIDLKRKIVINPAHTKKGEQYAPGNFFISYARDIIRMVRMDGLTGLRARILWVTRSLIIPPKTLSPIRYLISIFKALKQMV
jgi:hypothetical protein